MSKSSRQSKILDLITTYEIETQEELVERLTSAGFSVTQATISRDIKELNLVKTLSKNNVYKYCQIASVTSNLSSKFLNLFKEAVLSIISAKNLVIIKTLPQCSASVASVINEMNIGEIIGIVYSHDNIFIATSDDNDAKYVQETLSNYLI